MAECVADVQISVANAASSDGASADGASAKSAHPQTLAENMHEEVPSAEVIGSDTDEFTCSFTASQARRGSHKDRSVAQRELEEISVERQAFEVRLRQLRAEVRLCEASYEALLHKERKLIQEVGAIAMLEGDDVALSTAGANGTVFFALEGDVSPTALDDDASSGDDWFNDKEKKGGPEDMDLLDHVGIARCHQCGIRLPLDVTAIEEHCRSCFADERVADPPEDELMGRCCHCGKRLPLTTEGIEHHVCIDRRGRSRTESSDASSRSTHRKPLSGRSPAKSSRMRSWWRGSAKSSSPPVADKIARSPKTEKA